MIQVLHNLLSSFMSTYWSDPWLWPTLNCGRCKCRVANCNCGTGQKQPSSVHIQCNGTGRCHKWAFTNFIYLSFQFFFSINYSKYFLDWRKLNASPESYSMNLESDVCWEQGFKRTLPRNPDVKVELKSELILMKF